MTQAGNLSKIEFLHMEVALAHGNSIYAYRYNTHVLKHTYTMLRGILVSARGCICVEHARGTKMLVCVTKKLRAPVSRFGHFNIRRHTMWSHLSHGVGDR